MTAAPFVVFALPRTRSFWLSRFLSFDGWHCGHEEAMRWRSLADARSWFAQPQTGTVETAASAFWRLLPEMAPGARVVTLRRPISEVLDSLARGGLTFDPAVMTRAMRAAERKLDQIEARLPGVLRVAFADLATEAGCARVFEHCLPLAHNPAWWARLAPVNLQISLPAMLRYCEANAPQLAKLLGAAKHRSLAAMRPIAPVEADDGLTFQREPFAQAYRDGHDLFAQHMVATEQGVDDYRAKNLPLMQLLDDLGALHVTTARSNGRLFGYLVSVISPSLDAPDRVVALHTAFFASSAVRNLGMRLQRAALALLKARGVHEVQFRAGHRGGGPRLGTLYRRLGAVEFGQLYRLEFEETA